MPTAAEQAAARRAKILANADKRMGKVLQTSDSENLKEGSTSAAATRLTETDDVIATIQQQQLKHEEKPAQPRGDTTNVDDISDDEEEPIELMTPAAQRAQQDQQQAQQDSYFEKLQDSAARARFSQAESKWFWVAASHVGAALALRYMLSPRILSDQQSTSPTVLLLIESMLNLQACVGNAVLDSALLLVLPVVVEQATQHVTGHVPDAGGAALAAGSPEL